MSRDRERHPRFSFGIDPDARPSAPGRTARRRRMLATAIVLALLLAGGAYLYLYQPHSVRKVLGDSPPAVTRAYKWQAPDGGWHITSEPPPEGISYETIRVRSDTNVLPAESLRK